VCVWTQRDKTPADSTGQNWFGVFITLFKHEVTFGGSCDFAATYSLIWVLSVLRVVTVGMKAQLNSLGRETQSLMCHGSII